MAGVNAIFAICQVHCCVDLAIAQAQAHGLGMDPYEMDFAGEGSVEDVFCQNFTASQAGVGEVLSVSLCDGGDLRMVTEENRREFVELYVNYVLNKSIHRQVNLWSFSCFPSFHVYPARLHHASAACK